MTKVETARSLALEVLENVFIQQAYSNIALNKHLKGSQLSVADKGFGDRAGLWNCSSKTYIGMVPVSFYPRQREAR